MNAGKGLYIENGDLGYYHSNTTLYQMLGCSYVGDGYGYSTGNVSHVTGQGGTFVAGMEYDFPYQQPCDNYIDQIGSNGGTLLFRSQDNYGRIICYSGTSDSYRSIHATCVFGALRNGTHTKDQLMILYMNYLTQTIGVQEVDDKGIQCLTLSPNPSYGNMTVSFTLQRRGLVDITIYNSVGQRVRHLIHEQLDAGFHAINWNGKDDLGRETSSGTYIVTVDINNTVISKVLVCVN